MIFPVCLPYKRGPIDQMTRNKTKGVSGKGT
nr:hypothetical protein [Sicyoidochytrium minutum DNA virus]